MTRRSAEFNHTLKTVAATGATETIDLTTGIEVWDVTMDQNCTFTFLLDADNVSGAWCQRFTLILRGAFVPTWPASVDWTGGAQPTYATPSLYEFFTVDDGATWLATAHSLGAA